MFRSGWAVVLLGLGASALGCGGNGPHGGAAESENVGRATFDLTAVATGIGLAGVAVGVVLGTVFGLKSKSKHDDAASHCSGSTCSDAAGVASRSDAISAGNVSTVSFVVGAAGLVGGALLWFTASPNAEEPTEKVGLGWGSVGSVVVSGSF